MRGMSPVRNHRRKGNKQLRVGRCSVRNQIYHVSSATHGRIPVFNNLRHGRVLVNAMRREHERGDVDSLAFVVMPDHFHWLFALTGNRSLSSCVNTVKSFSTRRINEIFDRSGPLWQRGFYDRAIRWDEDVVAAARYIIANPIRAGIVASVKKYPLWDMKWI